MINESNTFSFHVLFSKLEVEDKSINNLGKFKCSLLLFYKENEFSFQFQFFK